LVFYTTPQGCQVDNCTLDHGMYDRHKKARIVRSL
jgi:hypothetical protein